MRSSLSPAFQISIQTAYRCLLLLLSIWRILLNNCEHTQIISADFLLRGFTTKVLSISQQHCCDDFNKKPCTEKPACFCLSASSFTIFSSRDSVPGSSSSGFTFQNASSFQ
jgi:hypothetical protein